MASSYGFLLMKVIVHRHGERAHPLQLGTLQPPGEPDGEANLGLRTVYGLLQGLKNVRLSDPSQEKHLQVTAVDGIGQCIKFTAAIGRSGEVSQIVDPQLDHAPVFDRIRRHIDTTDRRGLFLLPDHSTAGLLAIEAHGRSTGRDLLIEELKRALRLHTDGLITEFDPLADPAALARYLQTADVRRITLKRTGVPSDIANGLEMDRDEADLGRLELQIKPAGRRWFKRDLLRKLEQSTGDVRRQMLTVEGLLYDELNVQVQVGQRRRTVSVTGEQAPSFVYLMDPPSERPTDDKFYDEVNRTISEVSSDAGVTLGARWSTELWSDEGRAFIIERPAREESDESPSEGA